MTQSLEALNPNIRFREHYGVDPTKENIGIALRSFAMAVDTAAIFRLSQQLMSTVRLSRVNVDRGEILMSESIILQLAYEAAGYLFPDGPLNGFPMKNEHREGEKLAFIAENLLLRNADPFKKELRKVAAILEMVKPGLSFSWIEGYVPYNTIHELQKNAVDGEIRLSISEQNALDLLWSL